MDGIREKAARYALQKSVLKALKEENDLLGADLADGMRAMHAETGADRVSCEVGGVKVGTVSVRTERGGVRLSVTDLQSYQQWCLRHGFVRTDDRGALDYFRQTGEVPDGAEPVEYSGGGFAGISCRPDHDTVADLIASGALGDGVMALLGDGA
ncbi:hypothetical protein H6A18_09565 [Collinsella tanakaei]|uniref:hypothetical protein n=1 Tax=Collinsella tanakaei TaxID=626935 RepID=UPI00195D15D5|nr:hypothetical protein [Collinsella tanakaei]MBM6756749.1 hypothetical protein [Collinsella tanakaei]